MSETVLPFLPTTPSHKAPDNSPALYDDVSDEWLSYGSLRIKIKDLHPNLQSEDKKLIFCSAPRSIEGVTAYLAAAASNHAVAMIDSELASFNELIAVYQPYWVIAPLQTTINGYKLIKWNLQGLRLFQKETPNINIIHPDLYLLLLTSGSTGSSKGVRLSYKNLRSNTEAIIASLELTSNARAIAHLPLSYSYGLSILHMQLAMGGSCILTEHGMMAREFWHSARTQKATLFAGVPYHYEMLFKLGLARIGIPTLKTFLQAGGKLRDDLTHSIWQAIESRTGQLFVMYGQTEASPRISCLPVHKYPNKLGTCGQPLQNGKLVIEGEEVIYFGPNVMMGYGENQADLALGDVMNGRLATGDKGSIDSEGYLTVSGRKQRFAKLFGQRISLDDLEKIAGVHTDAVAIELADKIVLASTSKDQALLDHTKNSILSETKLPSTWFDIRSVEEFPFMPNGKIDYVKLRDML